MFALRMLALRIFLPASGSNRCNWGVLSVQVWGYYWSATPFDTDYAYGFYFDSNYTDHGGNDRSDGRAVRLVQNVD